jgi:hypothetical protein
LGAEADSRLAILDGNGAAALSLGRCRLAVVLRWWRPAVGLRFPIGRCAARRSWLGAEADSRLAGFRGNGAAAAFMGVEDSCALATRIFQSLWAPTWGTGFGPRSDEVWAIGLRLSIGKLSLRPNGAVSLRFWLGIVG